MEEGSTAAPLTIYDGAAVAEISIPMDIKARRPPLLFGGLETRIVALQAVL